MGDPHRYDRTMVAQLRQSVGGQCSHQPSVWLVGRSVDVLKFPLIRVEVVGLRVIGFPLSDFVDVDHHLVAVKPRRELVQPLTVAVAADAGAIAVVPAVHTTDEVVAANDTIGHHHATMLAAAIEHRVVVVKPHDHQVDVRDISGCRGPVGQLTPRCNAYWIHRDLKLLMQVSN